MKGGVYRVFSEDLLQIYSRWIRSAQTCATHVIIIQKSFAPTRNSIHTMKVSIHCHLLYGQKQLKHSVSYIVFCRKKKEWNDRSFIFG